MLPDSYVWPRPSSSIRLLSELQGPITFEQLVELKHSTFSELTNQILDDLIAAARENGSDTLVQAADVLENWDRHMDKDSVGAALFTAWIISYLNVQGTDIYAVQWDINDPLNTPRGLAEPDSAARTLETVAAQLEALRALGAGMDVPYGDVFRVRVGNYDLPANGGVDLVGTFYTLNFSQDRDLRFRAEFGESFIGVVEFSDPIRAQVLLTHGNATQPDSPHFGDQLQLLTEKRLREAWLIREDIEAHLEDRTVFNY
jgi:acyl-homoserine-lactone acylase